MKTNNFRALLLHLVIVVINWLLVSPAAEDLLGIRSTALTSSIIIFVLNIVLYFAAGRLLYKQGSPLKNMSTVLSILVFNAFLWISFILVPQSLKAPFYMLIPLLNFGFVNFFHFFSGWQISYIIATFLPVLLIWLGLQLTGRRSSENRHLEGFSNKDIAKLKKLSVLYGVVLTAMILVDTLLTLPKSFEALVQLEYEIQTVSLTNNVRSAPVVTITDEKDIDFILQILNTGKYRRKYHFPFVPKGGGGSLFALALNDSSEKQRVMMSFHNGRITINGKEYAASQDVSWKIAAYLMNKNLYQKAQLGLVETAHDNINKISKEYGEASPEIIEITPILIKKPAIKAGYTVHLQGHFKNGGLKADNLFFLVQEINPVFYEIEATNSNGKIIWVK